jgi:hypothetical protein
VPSVLLAVLMLAVAPGQTRSSQRFSEYFVEVRGVRLHYLDWGGRGGPEPLRA